MKKILLSFALLCCLLLASNGLVAQKNGLENSFIRPTIGVVAGSYYPFFERGTIETYHPSIIPYTIGLTAGVSLEEPHGKLLVQTGFVANGLNIQYPWKKTDHTYKIFTADFPVILTYDYRINETFSLSGTIGINFTRFLYYNHTVHSTAKPVLDEFSLDECWRDMLAYSVMGSVGFNYWFHPHFALQIAPYFKYYIHCPLEADWLLRPTLGVTVGVAWR